MARYRYIIIPEKSTVVCISTYAKKVVKGISKCSPDDTFSEEMGKELAKLRCDVKVTKKRLARAIGKLEELDRISNEIESMREDTVEYMFDSKREYELAVSELEKFEKSIGHKE